MPNNATAVVDTYMVNTDTMFLLLYLAIERYSKALVIPGHPMPPFLQPETFNQAVLATNLQLHGSRAGKLRQCSKLLCALRLGALRDRHAYVLSAP